MKRIHWKLTILIVLLFAATSTALHQPPPAAQAQGENCPALVIRALDSIADVCTGMNRNESCYGFNRVDAQFWEADPALSFNTPADRVPLATLQTLATAPLSLENGLWGVAALHLHSPDLPQILPGQAVMFLLMGDTEIENRVSPDDAAAPQQPIEVITQVATELRSRPATTANSLGNLPPGTRVQVVGQDESGRWAEILLTNGSHAWLPVDDLEAAPTINTLPVTFGEDVPPRYGPMQSFYFTTGLAGPSCNEAPDALVIQSPGGLEVSFNINNLSVEIGSTVAFTTVDADDGSGRRVLIGVLYEGHMTFIINGREIHFTEPGQAFALTLNENGLVDENSTFRLLDGAAGQNAWLANACQNAANSGLFDATPETCDSPITYYNGTTFEIASQFPGTLPQLGSTNPNPQPPVVINPPAVVPPPAPFVWPQITRPATLTELVGGGSHLTIWTPSPEASSYRLEIIPDTTNLEGRYVSFNTTSTQYDVPLDSMPSRESPGWGYFMKVIPLDGSGQPLAPPEQAPDVWVVRLDGAPPPAPAADPPPDNRNEEIPEGCYEICNDAGVCTIECPQDCVEIFCYGELDVQQQVD